MKYVLLTLAFIFALPLSAMAEEIREFNSVITLSADSSFVVEETIVYDFEDAARHGIFRYIPTRHPQETGSAFTERYIDIEVQNVTRNDSPTQYEIINESDQLYLKIGDPDRTISGEHTYTITYQVEGALMYYEDGTIDLYWNVTGSDWDVAMDTVRAEIRDPDELLMDDAWCYAGPVGSEEECGSISSEQSVFSDSDLAPNEELTIAQQVDAGKVDTVILTRAITWYYWAVVAVAWMIGLAWYVVRFIRIHRTRRTIIAQYEPYEEVKPMYTGLLLDGRLDPHDITAGIIYLAEQGYLKIRKTDSKVMFVFTVDDYELTLVKVPGGEITPFQRELIKLLFGSTQTAGAKVTLSELKGDHSKQKENYKLLTKLRVALAKDLIEQGFWERRRTTPLYIMLAALGLVLVMLGIQLLVSTLSPLFFFFVAFIGGTAAIGAAVTHKRRTRKGYQALDHLKGFKLFLGTTEKERYKFHNAPQKSPEQFMEYLPYAVAFKVEKEWAEVFKDVTIPSPSWYEGDSSTFSAVALTHSLGGFSDSFVASSGTSASAGGGSAGGGAGGGGGGSW